MNKDFNEVSDVLTQLMSMKKELLRLSQSSYVKDDKFINEAVVKALSNVSLAVGSCDEDWWKLINFNDGD